MTARRMPRPAGSSSITTTCATGSVGRCSRGLARQQGASATMVGWVRTLTWLDQTWTDVSAVRPRDRCPLAAQHWPGHTGSAERDKRHRRDVGWCASSVRCATAVDCGEHARSITTTKRASSAATSVDTATPDWTAACISRAVHGPTTRTTPRLYRCGCPTTAGRVRSRHRLLPFCASAR